MKNKPVYFLLIIFVFIFSCGRKQEEVKINKFSGIDSVPANITAKLEEPAKDEKDSVTSAGNNLIKITTEEVKNHINENAVVRGYVADVVVREKVAYLNFDKKFPKNTFSAVIFSGKFSEVGDLNIYKNQNVEVSGIINTYKDKPQIIVSSKNQIRIIK